MKGSFQMAMMFLIAFVESIFITAYFDEKEKSVSTIGLGLFFIILYLYLSFIKERYKAKGKS